MQIRVSTNDGKPIYQQIVDQIKYLVAAGRLQPEEQLPTVRHLAEQLVVNPNTVARAYRELEGDGVVASRRGSGVFVSDGGSPLAKREQKRILNERIDLLLAEARQMNVGLNDILKMVRDRDERLPQE